MSNSNKALFAVIGLIIIVGGLVAFVGSGTNGGTVPTPEPTAMATESMVTPTPVMSPEASAMPAEGSPTAMATKTPGSTVETVSFEVHGGSFYYKPNLMKVKKGSTVNITYINDGGMHDFNLDAFEVHSKKIQTGETTTVSFTVDKAGTFEYYCSVGNHRNMGQKGTLTVE